MAKLTDEKFLGKNEIRAFVNLKPKLANQKFVKCIIGGNLLTENLWNSNDWFRLR